MINTKKGINELLQLNKYYEFFICPRELFQKFFFLFFNLPYFYRSSSRLVISPQAVSCGVGGACFAGNLDESQVRHLFRSQVTGWQKVTGGKQKGI